MRCLTTFCALVAASAPTLGFAEDLFSTSYEEPTYSVGALDGQGGWVAPHFGVAGVTSKLSRSGSQAVEFDEINEHAQQSGPFPTTQPRVVVKQAVYIDGPDDEELLQEGFFVTPHAIGGVAPDNDFIGQISVINGKGNLGLGATLGSGDGRKGFVPIEAGRWFILKHVLDFANQTREAFVDGEFIASAPFANPGTDLSRVEMVVLNIPNHRVYFDDLSITAVPDPDTEIEMLGQSFAIQGEPRVLQTIKRLSSAFAKRSSEENRRELETVTEALQEAMKAGNESRANVLALKARLLKDAIENKNSFRSARDQIDAAEALIGLEWMVGEWTAEMVTDDGAILRILATTEWLVDKKFLRSKWVTKDAGRMISEREITWYWDSVEEVIRNQRFDSDRESGRATIEVGEAMIRGSRKSVDKVGKPISLAFVYKRTKADSYSFDEANALSLKFRRKT